MPYTITTIDKVFWFIGVATCLLAVVVFVAYFVAAYQVRKERKHCFNGKDIRNWIILLPLILMLSCTPTYHFTRLHESGTYTIASRNGNTTTFKEVSGKYDIESDTLKPGDRISITVISNHNR